MRARPVLASVLLLAGCRGPAFTVEPLEDVRRAVASGEAVLIDVREPSEWEAGHLRAARSLPVTRLEAMPSFAAELPRDRPIYTHCMVGVRARAAARILIDLGHDARPLRQGYVELVRGGFEAAPRVTGRFPPGRP